MSRLRILLLGPDCNPERVSISFVTYCHAAALAQLHDVTLVVRSPVENSVRRAKAPFRTIEVVRMPVLERIYAWTLRRIFKYNFDTQALTAFGYGNIRSRTCSLLTGKHSMNLMNEFMVR